MTHKKIEIVKKKIVIFLVPIDQPTWNRKLLLLLFSVYQKPLEVHVVTTGPIYCLLPIIIHKYPLTISVYRVSIHLKPWTDSKFRQIKNYNTIWTNKRDHNRLLVVFFVPRLVIHQVSIFFNGQLFGSWMKNKKHTIHTNYGY